VDERERSNTMDGGGRKYSPAALGCHCSAVDADADADTSNTPTYELIFVGKHYPYDSTHPMLLALLQLDVVYCTRLGWAGLFGSPVD